MGTECEKEQLMQKMFYSYCASSLQVSDNVWLQMSTAGPFWPQGSDGLSHGQDDPEPPDYIGLDGPQK